MLILIEADLHYVIYLIAFFSSFVRSKIAVTTSTIRETMNVPQNAVRTHITLPPIVNGKTSPYPTVVIVITISQTPDK